MNIERIMSSLEAKHPGESEYLPLARTKAAFVSMHL